MGYRMKVEVGQNYKVKNCDYAFEVVAIDNRNTVWGLASGVMLSRYHSEIISEWKDSPCSKCKDEPDLGEGWRLLHPDEDVEEGDQFLNGNRWEKSINFRSDKKQGVGFAYRRRIAPQYVPYTWEDRDELRGRWYRQKDEKQRERQVTILDLLELSRDRNNMVINGWIAKEFLGVCEWLDGSPCGKRVG